MTTTLRRAATALLAGALGLTVQATWAPPPAAAEGPYVAYAYTGTHLRASASWLAGGNRLCVRVFGGTRSDTARARVLGPDGRLIGELRDRGGDERETCAKPGTGSQDGRKGTLTVFRHSSNGTVARGSIPVRL